MSDKSMAKKSLAEEKQAVKSYTSRLRKTKSPKLRKALRHALPEERHHAQLFHEAVEAARN